MNEDWIRQAFNSLEEDKAMVKYIEEDIKNNIEIEDNDDTENIVISDIFTKKNNFKNNILVYALIASVFICVVTTFVIRNFRKEDIKTASGDTVQKETNLPKKTDTEEISETYTQNPDDKIDGDIGIVIDVTDNNEIAISKWEKSIENYSYGNIIMYKGKMDLSQYNMGDKVKFNAQFPNEVEDGVAELYSIEIIDKKDSGHIPAMQYLRFSHSHYNNLECAEWGTISYEDKDGICINVDIIAELNSKYNDGSDINYCERIYKYNDELECFIVSDFYLYNNNVYLFEDAYDKAGNPVRKSIYKNGPIQESYTSISATIVKNNINITLTKDTSSKCILDIDMSKYKFDMNDDNGYVYYGKMDIYYTKKNIEAIVIGKNELDQYAVVCNDENVFYNHSGIKQNAVISSDVNIELSEGDLITFDICCVHKPLYDSDYRGIYCENIKVKDKASDTHFPALDEFAKSTDFKNIKNEFTEGNLECSYYLGNFEEGNTFFKTDDYIQLGYILDGDKNLSYGELEYLNNARFTKYIKEKNIYEVVELYFFDVNYYVYKAYYDIEGNEYSDEEYTAKKTKFSYLHEKPLNSNNKNTDETCIGNPPDPWPQTCLYISNEYEPAEGDLLELEKEGKISIIFSN